MSQPSRSSSPLPPDYPPPAVLPPAASAAPQAPDGSTNVKETIESILVAFILAFIFRAFVVEAFVIPTGSMATTLLGAHLRYRCPDCGYVFDVNYSGQTEDDGDINIPSVGRPSYDINCPNCGYHIADGPREQWVTDASGRRTRVQNWPPNSPLQAVHYGDRILVMKYLYLVENPQRWDVVVFKSPSDPNFQLNFIKRLIGRPGESIMILDGDVYVKAPGATDYEIQEKPRGVQDALWRIIYDNDFYPQGLDRADGPKWQQPWTPEAGTTGWSLGHDPATGRVFTFDNASGTSALHFSPDPELKTQSFNDYLVYDVSAEHHRGPDGDRHLNPVSDLKLALTYARKSGDGALQLRMTKRDDAFTAEIDPDQIQLIHETSGMRDAVVRKASLSGSGINGKEPLRIEFQNVDYRVTLRVNGKDLIQTTREEYHPDVRRLIEESDLDNKPPAPTVQIIAANQACAVSHMGVWRDIYYTNRRADSERYLDHATPERPVVLGKDEYFVLGDNSPISGDARYWNDPVELPHENLFVDSGRVPGRFMLGKAFFVYWPAGHRPLDPNGPAIVPNFGDMRFIR